MEGVARDGKWRDLGRHNIDSDRAMLHASGGAGLGGGADSFEGGFRGGEMWRELPAI